MDECRPCQLVWANYRYIYITSQIRNLSEFGLPSPLLPIITYHQYQFLQHYHAHFIHIRHLSPFLGMISRKKVKKKSTKYVGDDSKKKPGNLPGRSPNRSPTEILISNHLSHEMVMSSHLQYQYQSYCLVSPFTDSSINPQYLG